MSTAVEIEKKYVIKMPNEEELRSVFGFSESEIVQIYLASPKGVTHRVRKRVKGGVAVYTETKKRKIDRMSALETEAEISAERFSELVKNQRPESLPIIKRRISFPHEGHIMEIDIYPEWERSCILEVELEDRDCSPRFPDFLEIIADVTGDKEYSNSSMSMRFPKELI